MTTERRRPKPAAYHLMSSREKQIYAQGQVRDIAVRCPVCDTAVMPVDLLGHIDLRCAGQQEPGPTSKWVTWREALAHGRECHLNEMTLSRWSRSDSRGRIKVRSRGPRGDRQYLLGDLLFQLAIQKLRRRRY